VWAICHVRRRDQPENNFKAAHLSNRQAITFSLAPLTRLPEVTRFAAPHKSGNVVLRYILHRHATSVAYGGIAEIDRPLLQRATLLTQGGFADWHPELFIYSPLAASYSLRGQAIWQMQMAPAVSGRDPRGYALKCSFKRCLRRSSEMELMGCWLGSKRSLWMGDAIYREGQS